MQYSLHRHAPVVLLLFVLGGEVATWAVKIYGAQRCKSWSCNVAVTFVVGTHLPFHLPGVAGVDRHRVILLLDDNRQQLYAAGQS